VIFIAASYRSGTGARHDPQQRPKDTRELAAPREIRQRPSHQGSDVGRAASDGSSLAENERRSVDGAPHMTKLMAAIAVSIALAVIAVLGFAWKAPGQVEMSTAGWVALVAGAVLSLAVGTGLTLLMIYSDRAGFDEQAQTGRSDDEDRQPVQEFAAPRRPPSPARRQTDGASPPPES
jgi:hypothetical protein